MTNTPHIGTLREKPLHASLKRWYSQAEDGVEVAIDGFVIDLVRDELLIEIQTRSFSSMKKKLATLLDLDHHVRIVYPIPIDKWIVKVSDDGEILSRRRSPKHGNPIDLFSELVSFPELAAHPNLDFDLVLINEEEFRRHTPDRAWRRKGWSVEERRLIDVVDTLRISGTKDLAALLPAELPDPFTTGDLATTLGTPRRAAQQMAYCLRKAGVIDAIGKKGNTVEYRILNR
jgi:hypothetical protein